MENDETPDCPELDLFESAAIVTEAALERALGIAQKHLPGCSSSDVLRLTELILDQMFLHRSPCSDCNDDSPTVTYDDQPPDFLPTDPFPDR